MSDAQENESGDEGLDSDDVSYVTLDSISPLEESEHAKPERLHEWLSAQDVETLHEIFERHPAKKLNYHDFRHELERRMRIRLTDLEYNHLFLRINQNRDFKLDWNEFVSYLIFGLQDDDPNRTRETLVPPISEPPVIRKSEHRTPVCAVTLLRSLDDDADEQAGIVRKKKLGQEYEEEPERGGDGSQVDEGTRLATGLWLTASKDGMLRFWTATLECVRSGHSDTHRLRMTTWVLAIQALSDVAIVCISSTERELRFHETMAALFSLRMVIHSLPHPVCTLAYGYDRTEAAPSRLVLGDFGGNVRLLEFPPLLRGPFQSKPGTALITVSWNDVLHGKVQLLRAREFNGMHTELIQQVHFSMRLTEVFAAAEYRNTKKYRGRCPGLVMVAVGVADTRSTFRIPLGVTAFFVEEHQGVVVTGGPDTLVRLWDVYVPVQPTDVLKGHDSGIVKVFVQSAEQKIYSIDYQKIVKVWHLREHTLLQTYGELNRLLSAEAQLVYAYHANTRELLVAGRHLVRVKCCARVRVDLTDGSTHAGPVSVVLYNHLYRHVVTCGLDSHVIVWDPWTGRRRSIIKHCHTKLLHGGEEVVDVEITAACFNPLEQFLLTGARDGTLKIWNYNDSVCMRHMSIKAEHEVTAVIWVIERILAVGWDQQVTEFNDVEGREFGDPKKWPLFHYDDITCADVKFGQGVVTATYSGEMIFWKLETGQPYRRFAVSDPTRFIELAQDAEAANRRPNVEVAEHIDVSQFVRKSVSDRISIMQQQMHEGHSMEQATEGDIVGVAAIKHHVRPHILDKRMLHDDPIENSRLKFAEQCKKLIPLSVQAVLFLQTRPMTPQHGSVFVALDTGMVQMYSHHQRGGYMGQFFAVHKLGDCILAMTTDRKNRYLFTGSVLGYVKVWLIINYCVPQPTQVCMPALRLQFIFLRKERFLTRAKRAIRHQPEPLLVNSYKAHQKAITSLVYINLPKILITGSYDFSCRLWSLGGRYLATLGTPLHWQRLSPFEPVDESQRTSMPPDIIKVASSTTLKVMTGVQIDAKFVRKPAVSAAATGQPAAAAGGRDTFGEAAEEFSVYAEPLREPYLGKYFHLPGKSPAEQHVELDSTLSYIPVYSHLKIQPTKDIERPPTPPAIRRLNNEQYMQFYAPPPVPKPMAASGGGAGGETGASGFCAKSKYAKKERQLKPATPDAPNEENQP